MYTKVKMLSWGLLHLHLWEKTISVRLNLVIHFGMAQAVQLASAVRSTLHRLGVWNVMKHTML